MAQVLKDLVSFIIYAFFILFKKNKRVVLVYHAVNETDPSKDPMKINVNPRLFEKQIEYLSKSRDKHVLTFDDGFESVYTNALPILRKYNMKAILFITTDFIDCKMSLDHFFKYKYSPRPLTWDQIKTMYSNGFVVGSHSLTHRIMASLDEKLCYEEASVSKDRIENEVCCNVRYFSYPIGNRGSFNDATEKVLKKIGYERAYTNIMGIDNSADEPFAIRRIRIYSSDNMFRFKMKIAGAYNWIDQIVPLVYYIAKWLYKFS